MDRAELAAGMQALEISGKSQETKTVDQEIDHHKIQAVDQNNKQQDGESADNQSNSSKKDEAPSQKSEIPTTLANKSPPAAGQLPVIEYDEEKDKLYPPENAFYIVGFDQRQPREKLYKAIKKYCWVVKFDLPKEKDKKNCLNKGFAFVHTCNADIVESIVSQKQILILNRICAVDYFVSRKFRDPKATSVKPPANNVFNPNLHQKNNIGKNLGTFGPEGPGISQLQRDRENRNSNNNDLGGFGGSSSNDFVSRSNSNRGSNQTYRDQFDRQNSYGQGSSSQQSQGNSYADHYGSSRNSVPTGNNNSYGQSHHSNNNNNNNNHHNSRSPNNNSYNGPAVPPHAVANWNNMIMHNNGERLANGKYKRETLIEAQYPSFVNSIMKLPTQTMPNMMSQSASNTPQNMQQGTHIASLQPPPGMTHGHPQGHSQAGAPHQQNVNINNQHHTPQHHQNAYAHHNMHAATYHQNNFPNIYQQASMNHGNHHPGSPIYNQQFYGLPGPNSPSTPVSLNASHQSQDFSNQSSRGQPHNAHAQQQQQINNQQQQQQNQGKSSRNDQGQQQQHISHASINPSGNEGNDVNDVNKQEDNNGNSKNVVSYGNYQQNNTNNGNNNGQNNNSNQGQNNYHDQQTHYNQQQQQQMANYQNQYQQQMYGQQVNMSYGEQDQKRID